MRYSGGARLPALLVGLAVSVPSFASHWVTVGSSSPGQPAGRIMVDTDSVHKLDQFTIVDMLTVYATPYLNSHGITLDRFLHRTAIDCARRTYVGLMTIGYLQGKRVGTGQETADWRTKLMPLPDDTLSNRIYGLVCRPPSTTNPEG